MKSILISLLIQVIKQLIGSTNWAEIFQAVADAALTPGLSGASGGSARWTGSRRKSSRRRLTGQPRY